jgi:hypothetical protein
MRGEEMRARKGGDEREKGRERERERKGEREESTSSIPSKAEQIKKGETR